MVAGLLDGHPTASSPQLNELLISIAWKLASPYVLLGCEVM
jgi:hypothetical protein